jgi:restriction system protein
MKNLKVPEHFRFIIPIVEVLKELGGSGHASEVTDKVIEKLNIPEEDLSVTIKSGTSRLINQMYWARLMLVKAGYLDSSERGVWTLTEKGLESQLSDDDLLKLYKLKKQWEKELRQAKAVDEGKEKQGEENETELADKVLDHRNQLLNILRSLPPKGFERICQRLLRESGFEKVTVTGRSGDGGIDGNGIFQVNPLVSFKVLFQCKRYQGAVTPTQVRDFRGAMSGRADKGIFMTTGYFTPAAKKEADRDGVTPIDLVDGKKLIDMFERVNLGLRSIPAYEIDEKFFDEFRI